MRVAEPSFYNPVDTSNAVFTISTATTNNTPAGENILVDLGSNHTIQFKNVTLAGNTELEIVPEGPPAPEGYSVFPIVSPLFYNIETSANYEDTIQLVLNYDDASITVEQEARLNLFVYNVEGEQWDLITTEVDVPNNLIGGVVTHLSLFTIMLQEEVEEPEGHVVTNTMDSGEGSLRQVLDDIYDDTGVVVITFQIPKEDPGFDADTGVWTITPLSELPSINDKHVIIDGTSQSQFIGEDTNPYGPEIEINGESAGESAQGLFFYNSTVDITHLTINRFSDAGILLWKVQQATIAGCYIGTGPDGFELAGNYIGIGAYDNCKHINIVPLDSIPNIVSGNEFRGIAFWDTCAHNLVAGNIIGLNRTGMEAVGGTNAPGINFLRCDSNTVVENWIGGNGNGIGIWDGSDNFIGGNRIGTDPEWTIDIFNTGHGIEIGHESLRNRIMGNFIGNNSGDGIRINGSQAMYNTISENSISMNESKGINLLDGANGGIAAPQFANVTEQEISGTAPPVSIVEIFTDNYDEGRIIQAVVLSDSEGNWGWAGTLEGPYDSIRATATDTMGNTSEFGLYRPGDEPSYVEDEEVLGFTLSTNHPGPDHPDVLISFDLPAFSEVKLDVYNINGAMVEEIHRGKLPAGWHSLTWNTAQHHSGVYLIRMQTSRGAVTKKCVVLK
jgi:hypothetical protein